MHHAWILSGPTGVGKFAVACEMARVLLDPGAGPDDLGLGGTALQTHEGMLLEAGNHPDLHIIRKEDAEFAETRSLKTRKQMNIPLDLIRERIIGGRTSDGHQRESAAWRTSFMTAGKVFILDESELIDPQGQNSLLKTMEEPPPSTWIFLVTSRPERLLPTIRSRCQHLRFGPLPEDDMRSWITESMPEAGDVPWLIQWSQGAPGMALRADESDLRQCAQDLKPMLDDLDRGTWNDQFGIRLAEFIKAFADRATKANAKASKEVANRHATGLAIRLLGNHVRARLATIQPGDFEGGERLWELANRIAETEDQVNRNLNIKHALAALAAGWSQVCQA